MWVPSRYLLVTKEKEILRRVLFFFFYPCHNAELATHFSIS
jgi:hypothetical protein